MRNLSYKKLFFANQQGQSLLEAMIALATAVIVVTVMSVVILSSLSNAQYTRDEILATQFAQEGIEAVKQMKEESWDTFQDLRTPDQEGNGKTASGVMYCYADVSVCKTPFIIMKNGTGNMKDCSQANVTRLSPATFCGVKNKKGPNVGDNGNNGKKYIRTITIDADSSSCTPEPDDESKKKIVKAEVDVYWTDAKCDRVTPYCHSVKLTTCVTNIDHTTLDTPTSTPTPTPEP